MVLVQCTVKSVIEREVLTMTAKDLLVCSFLIIIILMREDSLSKLLTVFRIYRIGGIFCGFKISQIGQK